MSHDASVHASDIHNIMGKLPPPDERTDVLVVGAGPAGCAAALEAARNRVSVTLVDEHPLSPDLFGLDVPYLFGGRMSAGVQNRDRMLQQVLAARPQLEPVYEAGVDVRLGTVAWGAFVRGPAFAALPSPVVGLSDGERSWLCGFQRLIVAAGARDFVLSFEGCDQPGVVGARAFGALLNTYDAFDGQRVVILGSDEIALRSAELAMSRGLEVAALVEVLDQTRLPRERFETLQQRGTLILTSHVIVNATRGGYGVKAATLRSLRDANEVCLDCDTICLAVDVVPNIELVSTIGARLRMSSALGGHVPLLSESGETSVPDIYVVGDAAGIKDDAVEDVDSEARRIARAVVASLTAVTRAAPTSLAVSEPRPMVDRLGYRLSWIKALVDRGGFDVIACQCESVSRADLLGVQPPRYLGERSPKMAAKTLRCITEHGQISADQVKRLTRAGMGPCQGRRCREQVAMLLALDAGAELGGVKPGSYRPPLRPLPLSVLANFKESEPMQRLWDIWFGIRAQWVPYEDIGTEREAEWLTMDSYL